MNNIITDSVKRTQKCIEIYKNKIQNEKREELINIFNEEFGWRIDGNEQSKKYELFSRQFFENQTLLRSKSFKQLSLKSFELIYIANQYSKMESKIKTENDIKNTLNKVKTILDKIENISKDEDIIIPDIEYLLPNNFINELLIQLNRHSVIKIVGIKSNIGTIDEILNRKINKVLDKATIESILKDYYLNYSDETQKTFFDLDIKVTTNYVIDFIRENYKHKDHFNEIKENFKEFNKPFTKRNDKNLIIREFIENMILYNSEQIYNASLSNTLLKNLTTILYADNLENGSIDIRMINQIRENLKK